MKNEKIGNIAFDADDVLIDNVTMLNLFHNNKYGTRLTVEDYYTFNLSQVWGINENEIRNDERMYYKSDYYKQVKRIHGAYESIEYLSQNYGLPVITGRGVDVEQYLFSTLNALYEPHHFSSIDHIGAANRNGFLTQKWEKCKERNASLLIDDFQGHLIRAAENGIYGIMVRQPWNKYIVDLPKNIYRARNLSEAVEIIEKNEKIFFTKD